MKTYIIAAAIAGVTAVSPGMATVAEAGDVRIVMPSTTSFEPTFFAGLTWSLGNAAGSAASLPQLGFTLKYLSTNEPGTLAASVGVSYFLDGSFGCDAGVGLNEGGLSVGLSYDFCRLAPTFSFGGIKKPETTTTNNLKLMYLNGGPT